MATPPSREVAESRLAFIRLVMEKQKLKGNPRRHVVLLGWNRIMEWDRDFQVNVGYAEPDPGASVWVAERIDSPELTLVLVLEHRDEGFWVKPHDRDVQFLVARDDVKMTPIPFAPFALHRRDLEAFLGSALYKFVEQARTPR